MKELPQDYHVQITDKTKRFELNLKEVWQYRDLILLLTQKKFTLTYKQTVLGPLWAFINPILTSLVFTLVFGQFAKIDTNGVPHMLFYLCSYAMWAFFSGCVNSNATTFTSNSGLFGKVYFPRLTVPISTALFNALRYGLQMIVSFVVLFYYAYRGTIHPLWQYWVLLPALLVWLGILGSSVGIIVSSLTTKYRDLVMLVSFGVRLWMYVSPVVYPLSQLQQGRYARLLLINPVTAPMELYRRILLGEGQIVRGGLAYSFLLTVVLALSGIIIFNRVEKTFMDTV